eukprot:m.168026 g.168026  ORF g.168026 m.168026 type:complete len:203 (-) comp10351_c0_seq12:425-1033(-)
MADAVAQRKFEVQSIEADIAKLQTQIVQSPDRIRREIAHRSEQLELEKEHVLATERKAMQIKSKVDEYERLASALSRTCTLMETTVEFTNQKKTGKRDLEKLLTTNGQEQQVLRDLSAQHNQVQRQISTAKDKLGRLQRQQEMRRQQETDEMDKLQQDYERVASEQRHGKAEVCKRSCNRSCARPMVWKERSCLLFVLVSGR